jgi:hypothetical protein
MRARTIKNPAKMPRNEKRPQLAAAAQRVLIGAMANFI